MTDSPQAHPAQAAGSRPSSLPAPDPGQDNDAGALGQAIANRLFSAGFDLHFALALAGDGASPAAQRLRHAVGELDEAIKDLRHLMLTVLAPADGAGPDGTAIDIRSRHLVQVTDSSRRLWRPRATALTIPHHPAVEGKAAAATCCGLNVPVPAPGGVLGWG